MAGVATPRGSAGRDEALLRRLGGGEPLADVAASQGWTIETMKAWFARTAARRGAPFLMVFTPSRGRVPTERDVRIERDERGTPHIMAETDEDLFYGFGWAMSEDRLFQLDYLRRKAKGELSELVGADELCVSVLSDNRGPTPAIELDRLARTVGFGRIAAAQWETTDPETRTLLARFCDGINGQLSAVLKAQGKGGLPVECALLDYEPAPFTPQDMLAIETDFRWYLTGRFPVICSPELAKDELGEGALLQAFLLGEADEEAVLPAGVWAPLPPELVPAEGQFPSEPAGASVGHDTTGSNNWCCSGERTASGGTMVGSDPHVRHNQTIEASPFLPSQVGFEAVSCWYNVHLCGGSFDVVGCAYVGVPAVMFGRNQHLSWGITNNICSQRDLYRETANDRGEFLHDGSWEAGRSIEEIIKVKGGPDISLPITFSRHGPIVNGVLPAAAAATTAFASPISLQWVAAQGDGWIEAMLAMDRASSVPEFREALRPWHSPTFNLSVADVHGSIGMVSCGRLPLRGRALPSRGMRDGSTSEDDWLGYIPYDAMPHAIDPPTRNWLASANNRLADDSFPYPLGGTWASGFRGQRIRQMFEESEGKALTVEDMAAMQMDHLSLPAVEDLPLLAAALGGMDLTAPAAGPTKAQLEAAREAMLSWDAVVTVDSVGVTVYRSLMGTWCAAVAAARFSADAAPLLAGSLEPLARRLLSPDYQQELGWFGSEAARAEALQSAFVEAVAAVVECWGGEDWQWGQLHKLPLRHVLGALGDGSLATLLDAPAQPIGGGMDTVGNTGQGAGFLGTTGAGYRHVADLGASPPGLWLVDGQSQSGQVHTAHYGDQWDTWAEGKLEFVPLGPDYKGQTTTVLRSEGTYMPTAGAARVERNSSPETNFEPSSRPKL